MARGSSCAVLFLLLARRACAAIDWPGSVGPEYDYYVFTPLLGKVDALADYLDAQKFPLEELLTQGSFRGILVLYVLGDVEVWGNLLQYILAEDTKAEPPLSVWTLASEAESYRKRLPAALQEGDRVRVETPLDFLAVLRSIHHHLGRESFRKWFGHVTYDAPKLVNSIAAIRALGREMPVVRLDETVLFNYHSRGNMKAVRALVEATVRDYHASIRGVFTQSFLLSQQYSGVLAETSRKSNVSFSSWNEAYATMAVPALLATEELCVESQFKEAFLEAAYHPSPSALEESTRGEVMAAFYGLETRQDSIYLETRLPSDAVDDEERRDRDAENIGITFVGSNPTHSLISGAALTTGAGVALDLPPMLHTELFIMWVDDHLLSALTAEVLATKRRAPPAAAGAARAPDVRPPQLNTARFALEFYVPTTVLGSIFDAWINAHPDGHLLKFRPEQLSPRLAEKLRALAPASGEALGPLSQALQRARYRGSAPNANETVALRHELWAVALQRLRDVYWLWSRLPQPVVAGKATPSFATLWSAGRTCGHRPTRHYCNEASWPELRKPCLAKFCAQLGRGMLSPAWDALASRASRRGELPQLSAKHLLPAFRAKVEALVETAETHILWTVDWPLVCQAIRSLPPGQVATDLEFGHNDVAGLQPMEVKI